MLRIHANQLSAFGAAMRCRFEDEMLEHLVEFSPPLFRTLKDAEMREPIRLGIARAAAHHLTHRGPVRSYLEMMLLFGSFFDTDPQYSWASEILSGPGPQMRRATLLYEKAVDYRAHVIGHADKYAIHALRQLRSLATRSLDWAAEDFTHAMLRTIEQVYPEKARYVGEGQLCALVHEARLVARDNGIIGIRGEILMCVLMLAFGHGCASDPLYPWIGRALSNSIVVSAEARARQLEKRSIVWLDHVLTHFTETEQR